MAERFDAIIIGTGQAGPPLAGRLTEAGWRIVVVERQRYGGTCVNYGCTPTKTLIASARPADVGGGDRGAGPGRHAQGQGAQGRDRRPLERGRRVLGQGDE